jgi:hypothetical protein
MHVLAPLLLKKMHNKDSNVSVLKDSDAKRMLSASHAPKIKTRCREIACELLASSASKRSLTSKMTPRSFHAKTLACWIYASVAYRVFYVVCSSLFSQNQNQNQNGDY